MMQLALRDILRQRARSAMTLAAIVAGVAGLIIGGGWVADIFVQLGESIIHSQSGHLQVFRAGYFASGSRSPEKYLMADVAAIKQRSAALPAVSGVMARLNFSGLLNNGRSDLPIIGEGVEAAAEAELGSYLKIIAGRQLGERDRFGVLVGQGVAQALKLKSGDRVVLLANTLEGALNSVDLEVVGVFQTMSKEYDSRALRIPLAVAQDLIGNVGANAVVIALRRTADTAAVAAALRRSFEPDGLEVKTWVELNEFYRQAVELYRAQFGFLQFIILIMVLLSVTNSVNMSIFERVGEFGTMMALGNRSGSVFRLIVAESLILGGVGSALGLLFGAALALAISAIGIDMPPPPNANVGYTAHVLLSFDNMAASFAIGLASTVLASILPARRVSRIPVVDALRENV